MKLSQGHSFNRYAWLVDPDPNTLTFNYSATRKVGMAASAIAKCVVAVIGEEQIVFFKETSVYMRKIIMRIAKEETVTLEEWHRLLSMSNDTLLAFMHPIIVRFYEQVKEETTAEEMARIAAGQSRAGESDAADVPGGNGLWSPSFRVL